MAPLEQGPEIGSIDVPEDLYWVVQGAPAIAGMREPHVSFPWFELEATSIRHVVCLTGSACEVPEPFQVVHSSHLFDHFGGGFPPDPSGEERSVHEAADAVVDSFTSGHGVVVHCLGGRGRTGTVIGVALARLGVDTAEVEGFLDRLHRKRGRPGWPESSWQSEVVHRAGDHRG